jgi:LacI family transcriptional regulator
MAGSESHEDRNTGLRRMPRKRHIPRVLLLIDTAGSVGRHVVRGIGRYALENGPWSLQFEYRALDSSPPTWLTNWRGDGIIARSADAKTAKLVRETGLPTVELLGDPKRADFTYDFQGESRMVVRHFLDAGLRHLAHFSYGDSWWTTRWRDSFRQTVEEHGHTCHHYESPTVPTRVVFAAHQLDQTGLVKWLRSLPRPIGVCTFSDLQAVQLLNACQELGISVPEEIAIVGRGNDVFVCDTVRPTLTSVDLNACLNGFNAARLLDARMAGRQPKTPIPHCPSYVAGRQSTDLVAVPNADVVHAIRYIRDCASTGIKVAQVADEVGISRRLLERRFLEHIGRTPKDEITRVQVQQAQSLLASTDFSCEQVAARSGFGSIRHLSTVFHREVGTSPSAYRKTKRIAGNPDESADMS